VEEEKMAWDLVISMMTEKEFWDKFNSKHNPGYFHAKKKRKKENQKKNKKQKNNGNS
jgi:hypothetical protein